MPIIPNDPFGGIKADARTDQSTPQEVSQFHEKDDADAATTAHHHTLGTRRNQATSGAHKHLGNDGSLKLGSFTLTGKNAPASVAELDTIVDQLITWLSTVFDVTDSRT